MSCSVNLYTFVSILPLNPNHLATAGLFLTCVIQHALLGGLLRNISSRASLERAFTLIVFLIPLSPSIFIGGGKWSVNLALEESAHTIYCAMRRPASLSSLYSM